MAKSERNMRPDKTTEATTHGLPLKFFLTMIIRHLPVKPLTKRTINHWKILAEVNRWEKLSQRTSTSKKASHPAAAV